ncbi:MAG: pyridoxamine 5'-phosphate oxidase family protein [Nitrospinaceae bacterium]
MTPLNPSQNGTRISDIAFTAAVKAQQEQYGSRELNAKMMQTHDWSDSRSPDLESFIGERDSFYLGTTNAQGQPYIQHRGGPKGFLKVLGPRQLAFADYSGNRQYITLGNLDENSGAFIFLMDYAHRRRVKIWGTARVDSDPALLERVRDPAYSGRPERVIIFTIRAWDVNCPQHIQPRLDEAAVREAVQKWKARVAQLEAENEELKARLREKTEAA